MKNLVKQWLGPALVQAMRMRWLELRAAMVRTPRAASSPIYLQLGAGDHLFEGFVNMDLLPRANAVRANVARRIPVADGSVAGVFAEHVFEHIDYRDAVPRLLAECRRVMRAGAVLRIVVPDAGAYLQAYARGGWDEYTRMRPLDAHRRDFWLRDVYRTRMELINAVFRQNDEHKYAYDEETLMLILADAGFTRIRRCAFRQGGDPMLLRDTPERSPESLYVEAVNP